MIYILITTCLIKDNYYNIREKQYKESIPNITKKFNNIPNTKIIILENNNNTSTTFLDEFDVDVLYTDNNLTINTKNKGLKEYNDILSCINKYDINDDDFIVKITGRYNIKDNSNFINELMKLENTDIDCIIRYGNYYDLESTCKTDCISGLFGMKCKYIKKVKLEDENECIEWKYGTIASTEIPEEKVIELRNLGLLLCPASYSHYIEV